MAKWDKPVMGPTAPIAGPPITAPPIAGPRITAPQILPPPGVFNPPGIINPPVATNPAYFSDPTAAGVTGESNTGPGVVGRSLLAIASDLPSSGASDGVLGESDYGNGVHGITYGSGAGVSGASTSNGVGVYGESKDYDGVSGISHSKEHAGVSGHNDAGGAAGWFGGDVTVTGQLIGGSDVTCNGNLNMVNGNVNIGSQGDVILNDCAEHFDVVDTEAGPGTVMVIDHDGNLQPCSNAYDKKVAGVVSGAGNFKPGIILGKHQSQDKVLLIALLGKVYCNVDAQYSPIEVGDLLTTSPTPGHAMKAADPWKAFGCVIGKALRPLENGLGLIPILIALQ